MGRKQPQARWMVVTDYKDANGEIHQKLTVIDGPVLPWRISSRKVWASAKGIEYVRSLPRRKPWDDEGVSAVSVCDGKRPLASWRRMEKMSGYTGTYDVHPLIAAQFR